MDPNYYAVNLTEAKCEDSQELVYAKHLKSEKVGKKSILITDSDPDVNGKYIFTEELNYEVPVWRKDDCTTRRIEKDSDGDWCIYGKNHKLLLY
jgi:hypothetical protein